MTDLNPERPTRDSVLANIGRIEGVAETGQYAEAIAQLNNLIASLNDDALRELQNVAEQRRDTIRQQAIQARDRARQALDEILIKDPILDEQFVSAVTNREAYQAEVDSAIDSIMSGWQRDAQAHLDAWANTLEEAEQDSEFKRYRDVKYIPRVVEVRRILYAQAIGNWVQALWKAAENARQREVAAVTLLESYYNLARDIATEAAANDPARLGDLAERTRNEREKQATAAQIMTSAVQEQEYSRSLRQLADLPDDEEIPGYQFLTGREGDLEEQQSGYITVAKARAELKERARTWAEEKYNEYRNDAEKFLDQYDPKAALKALEDRAKIDEFLDSDLRRELNKLEQRAQAQLQQVKAASDSIAETLAVMPSDPIRAWQLFREAEEQYSWSSALRPARNTIITTLSSRLESERVRAREARDKGNFDQVHQIMRAVKDDYGRIQDNGIKKLVADIDSIDLKTFEYERMLVRATQELAGIQQLTTSNPERAFQDLQNFETEFGEVLPYLENLDTIRSQVLLQVNAKSELDRLRDVLRNRDTQTVDRSIRDAQAAVREFPNDQDFVRLRDDLELHRDFLRAERERENGFLKQALDLYKKVATNTEHPDAGDASNRRDEVIRILQEGEQQHERLDQIEAMLVDDPIRAFRDLMTIQPADSEQRNRYYGLKNRARTQSATKITQYLERVSTQKPLPLEDVENNLRALEEIGENDSYRHWFNSLKPQMAAQTARELYTKGKEERNEMSLNEALKKWQEAIELAQQANQTAITQDFVDEQRQTEREYAGVLIPNLMITLAGLTGEMPLGLNQRIEDLQNRLDNLSTYNINDTEVLLWKAQLKESLANNSIDPSTRKNYYQQAEVIATQVITLLRGNNRELSQKAETIQTNAEQGAALASTMLTANIFLSRGDINSLVEAHRLRAKELQPKTVLPAHRRIRDWWEEQSSAIIKQLDEAQDAANHRGRLSRVIPAVALEPDDPRAQKVFADSGAYKDVLTRDVKKLNEDKYVGSEIQVGANATGLDVLSQQVKAVENRYADIIACQDLANALPDLFKVDLGTAVGEINTARDTLITFQDAINKLNAQLTSAQSTGKFGEVSTKLEKLHRFENHPAYRHIQEQITARKERRTELQAVLENIRVHIQSEAFDNAKAEMDTVNDDDLGLYGLSDDYTVESPHSGNKIVGWEDVRDFVLRQTGVFAPIIDFITVFEEFEEIEDGKEIGTITKSPPSGKRVINWHQYKEVIREHMDRGEYTLAESTLDKVLKDTGETHLITLSQAIEHAKNPITIERPLTEQEKVETKDNPEKRWSLAIELAGSLKGQHMLEQAKNRRKTLINYQREANKIAEQIQTAQENWQSGIQQWEDGIKKIAERFDDMGTLQPGNFKLRQHRAQLKAAVEWAYQGYKQCYEISKSHPQLTMMYDPEGKSGLWLFEYARHLSNFNPS